MSQQTISICPISTSDLYAPPSGWPLVAQIADSISIEDVSQVMDETDVEYLARRFFGREEAENLANTRHALVCRSEGDDLKGREEDPIRRKLLYHLYIGLKIFRPTAGRFQVLHYDMEQASPRVPRIFRTHHATILCDYEGANLGKVRWEDLQDLAAAGPSIADTLKDARNPVSQAVQSLEIGYRADFLNVRHLLWVVGLDALFTSSEPENRGSDVAIRRITDFLDSDFRIYPNRLRKKSDFVVTK